MVHADLSHELLCTIFMPRTELHDGAVIIRGDAILAAAALLPLTEMQLSERFGTRHRAALGITEDTDAVAVVVSEESGQMSVVERARIVRVPNEAQLERALLAPAGGPERAGRPRPWRLQGHPSARPVPDRAPPRPRRGDHRRGHAAASPARPPASQRPPPARGHACRRASADGRAARRGGRRRGGRLQPVNARRGVRRLGRHHRPQLAAQAGRRGPRDAALRGPRGIAGQRTYPGPHQGDAGRPAGRHRHHQPAARRRADPLHRPGGPRAGCAPRTSSRPWTCPASSPTATRSTCAST